MLNLERRAVLSITVSPSTQYTFNNKIVFYCYGWILRCKTAGVGNTGVGNTGVVTPFGFANGCPGAAEEEQWLITTTNISNVYFTKLKTLIMVMQLSAPGMYIFPPNLVQPPQNSRAPEGWQAAKSITSTHKYLASPQKKKKISCYSDLAPGYLFTPGVHLLFGWKSYWQKNCFQVTVIFVPSVILRGWSTLFQTPSQNCEKRLLASSCLSVCPLAWKNSATTEGSLKKFDILVYFEICRENSNIINIQ